MPLVFHAQQPKNGVISYFKNWAKKKQFKQELKEIAPKTNVHNGNWKPGNGPSQVVNWAVESIAKAGTYSIIGVYPGAMTFFPLAMLWRKILRSKWEIAIIENIFQNCLNGKKMAVLIRYLL